MAAESSRSSTSSADSYIGSLISLTSKSEIRYEGILYNINTEESSIGLRNVRSFGSEGRKKDGPQIMPSDKVYEYILFRGSDIKDLQVKTSPPVQPTQPINSDPAIIQSHYPRPQATSSNPIPDPTTHNPQLGHPGSSFQGGMPLYQPDGTMGTWGPSPPPPNTSGLAMPMYWPGFYAPPNGLPQLHQQSMFRPMPQYPNFNPSNLPEYSTTATTTTATTSLPPVPPLVLTTEPLPSFLQTKPPNSVVSAPPVSGGLPPVTPATTGGDVIAAVPPLTGYQGVSRVSSIGRTSSIPNENPTPSLVTPGQLLQSGQAAVVSSQPSQAVEPPPLAPPAAEPSAPPVPVSTEPQPPILPLPTQPRNAPKMNGASYHNHHNYRGRERGRGSGVSRPAMKFTEEFDFTAMNEKFNKDEVWGTLGKTKSSEEDELQDENISPALPNFEVKPVYSKDDFFDTLSCNSNDHQSNNGRTRFSEQMKLDTETFGEFSRYRGGRGGRGPYRGGRFRGGGGGGGGGYYHHGRGYGYVNRGRGGGGRSFARDY